MKYLLDVNALVALGNGAHAAHAAAEQWLARKQKAGAELASCAVTTQVEGQALGFNI